MASSAQLSHQGSAHEGASVAGQLLQVVTFHVGPEIFGLDILVVHEIIRFQPLTRVPNLPAFVEGVLNLRGKVIPVVGLRQRMGLERKEPTGTTKIIVASVKGDVLGFMVDSVSEVLRIDASAVEPAPRIAENGQRYVQGVGKLENSLLLLLNIDKVLTDEESAAVSQTNDEVAK